MHVRDPEGFVVADDGGQCHLDLAVEGIDCAACLVEIEDGLTSLPGVVKARLNLTTRRVGVDWRAGETSGAAIVERLATLGYAARPFDPARAEARGEAETRRLLRCLGVAAFAAMNIMLLSVSVWSGNASDITPETRDFFHWVSGLIALPAVAYAGRPFFDSAIAALKAGRLNMDVPISLGVLLALGLSVYETTHHAEHAYFDSAVMLLLFLLAGRLLDQNMRRRASVVARNVAALRGETAAVIRPDGTLIETPLSRIDPGMKVMARAGERIGVDGLVVDGRSLVDQSLVTGETDGVPVAVGDRVYAGTLNGDGALTIRVITSKDTFLDEVGRLLDVATQERSRFMRLADRASRAYAPVVHATALLTAIGWIMAGAGVHQSIVTAIAVLIITCPCALGLAIPAVQVVASGRLFTAGVLLNSGDAIERLATADTVVFDKTGTLTLPEPFLLDRATHGEGVVALARRLAAASRHPLALALARSGPAQPPPEDARETRGMGVEAVIDGVRCRLGSPIFCDAQAEAAAAVERHRGCSVICFRRGTEAPVVFAFRQGLRPDAIAVIDGLRARGMAVEILSGDRPEAVAAVAESLGVTDFAGGATPQMKISRIEALKAGGRKVLMVGDGLNDAPALAAADVSLSPVSAVDLAQNAADAVFLGVRLAPILSAIVSARVARRVMVQNLWIAVVYNFIAVPLAIAGLATPLVAALAMSGSSVIVTLNALRARSGGQS
ncbi:MAG: heavy metal translocating P-type ATPase [Labrys sp. (in: a-proteobacteria)]